MPKSYRVAVAVFVTQYVTWYTAVTRTVVKGTAVTRVARNVGVSYYARNYGNNGNNTAVGIAE